MVEKEVIQVTRGKNLAEVVKEVIPILDFNGDKGEEVGKTLLLASLRNESVESTAKNFNLSGQTVRLHAQREGEEIGEKLLQRAREEATKLKGLTVNISIDWTEITYYGEKVEGVVGGKKGYSWSFATATAKVRKRTWILGFVMIKEGMSKGEIVKQLLEQAEEIVKINMIVLDAGFYTLDVLNLLLKYKFVLAVPVGSVHVKEELDKIYTTNSKRHKRDEQVTFRLVTIKVKSKGHGKEEKLLGYATNLDLSPKSIRRIYNVIRSPIETSYRVIKSFLPFTSSTKYSFRFLVISLAILLYSLLISQGITRSEFSLSLEFELNNYLNTDIFSLILIILFTLISNYYMGDEF
ncbi:DUF4322 domain-containing protein [Saccharolobus caldissimus]|uniref:ISH3 family transposase ISSto14 n=1 Tax=Saccharolobus caldissimus TaxID=1702097 RepID=A0AAQ4CV41_9CREN|nr:DUF4322 domain-containing protein [Saccharolobus caldissimus]BDB99338.1 ISH3 family transposase ISSto14 [Saccharolobus caldissimus]BDB99672.1 ISH3 family transposase ISSto14 [Saccharolobus caldissimus]